MNKFKNANMWQKSAIQMIQENDARVATFHRALTMLMEHYMINGNIFGFGTSGPVEINSGYFEVLAESTTLEDAIKEMKDFSYCVRINENDKFQIGLIRNSYNECDQNNQIFDIKSQIIIG